MSRIYVLGDIMADVLVHLPGPLALGSDTPAPIRFGGGGSAANTAVWLAQTGIRPTLIARVGEDPPGLNERQTLWQYGVDLSVTVDATEPTGACVVFVHQAPDGTSERTMIPNAGANGTLRPEHLPSFEPESLLYVSAYALFSGARAAAMAAMERVRASDGRLVVGAASAALLSATGPELVLGWIGQDALLITNRDEAEVLSGRADPSLGATDLAAKVGACVVTCGAAGAYLADATGVMHVPAPALADAAVDTVGAGDAFAAGVLHSLRASTDLVEAVRLGHRLAARSVALAGSRPPL